MKFLLLGLLIFTTVASEAQTRRRKPYQSPSYSTPKSSPSYESNYSSSYASSPSRLDFSGTVGFHFSGFGVLGLAAYRVLDDVLFQYDNSVSIESGVGAIFWDTTSVEIPIMGRWGFKIPNSDFTAGPRIGGAYLSGPGGFFGQVGGFGMYKYNSDISIRADLGFGGYTSLMVGATYFY